MSLKHGASYYIEIGDATAVISSDGQCKFAVTAALTKYDIHGYVGPYKDSETAAWKCGALVTVSYPRGAVGTDSLTFTDGTTSVVLTNTIAAVDTDATDTLIMTGGLHSILVLKVPDDAATDLKYKYSFGVRTASVAIPTNTFTVEITVANKGFLATLIELMIPLGAFAGMLILGMLF